MNKSITGVFLAGLISSGVYANANNIKCNPLQDFHITSGTVISNIKDRYSSILDNISICAPSNNDTNKSINEYIKTIGSIEELIGYISNDRDKKLIRTQINSNEKENFIISKLNIILQYYNINRNSIFQIYKEINKIYIYTSKNVKNKDDLVTKSIENIARLSNDGYMIEISNNTKTSVFEIVEQSEIQNLGNALGVDIEEGNQRIYQQLDILELSEYSKQLKDNNKEKIEKIKQNITFMIIQITNEINILKTKGLGNKSIIDKKIKVFIDYREGKETFLQGYITPFMEGKISEMLNLYNSI